MDQGIQSNVYDGFGYCIDGKYWYKINCNANLSWFLVAIWNFATVLFKMIQGLARSVGYYVGDIWNGIGDLVTAIKNKTINIGDMWGSISKVFNAELLSSTIGGEIDNIRPLH
jgi:hypothetical protein